MKTLFGIVLLTLPFGLCMPAAALDAAGHAPDAPHFKRTYAGTIDGKYAVAMSLRRSGETLKGEYAYAGKKRKLMLEGKVDAAGHVTLQEWIDFKQTGVWTGTLAGDSFTGTWQQPGGAKQMAFDLHKTAEIRMPTKQEMLEAAVGTYRLKGISGAAGANGMFDIDRQGSTWRASSSSISNGMREGQEDPLSAQDVRLLDSMHITVDKDLNTRFYAGGKLLLDVPFNATGMLYRMDHPHSSVLDEQLKGLGPSAVRVDVNGNLYLAALDGIDYAQTLNLDNVIAEGLLVLTYNPDTGTFDLNIAIPSCCDNNTLTFIRQ
jgi:hypothetical protein